MTERAAKLRVHNFTVSLDGYAAGPEQGPDHPLGLGAEHLHDWMFATRTGLAMIGTDGGTTGLDDDFVAAGDDGIGATIIGRNMFGPVRGSWGDELWTGWWGDDPPYHHPVFVLTHHPRRPIVMHGGTTFHFVTDGIQAALEHAFEAADGADVRVGGGASTVRQYLQAGLVDGMHIGIAPVLVGSGERLFDGLGALDGYTCTELVSGGSVVHARFTREAD